VRQPEHLYGICAILVKAGTKAALAFAVSMTLFLNAAHASGLVTFTSPNPQVSGLFGTSVATNGPIVVVGAPQETGGGYSSAGHAYITDTTKPLTITLTSSNPQVDGSFGTSVAISGTTVVVGAPQEDAGGNAQAGNAYVFDAASGDLVCTLTSPNPQATGSFGFSVAISGQTVVVGAPFEDAFGISQAGNAYVFDANLCTQLDIPLEGLSSPNPQATGAFGFSVAVSGQTVVVGAPTEDAGVIFQAGNAYLFDATDGSLVSTLTSPNAETQGFCGVSVSISGTTVVAGAPNETGGGQAGAGNAYVFVRQSDGVWIQEAVLTSPNAKTQGFFGLSVSIDGQTVVAGAPGETTGGQERAGHAYVYTFEAIPDAWVLGGSFASPYAQEGGLFGQSVAGSFDSASGETVLLFGAPVETAGGQEGAGHSYLNIGTAP